MTLVSMYGQKLGQTLHLKDAPSLITRSLRSAELAVTETRDDNPLPGLSGSFPSEDAYLVSLKFRDYENVSVVVSPGPARAADDYRKATSLKSIETSSMSVMGLRSGPRA